MLAEAQHVGIDGHQSSGISSGQRECATGSKSIKAFPHSRRPQSHQLPIGETGFPSGMAKSEISPASSRNRHTAQLARWSICPSPMVIQSDDAPDASTA